MTKLPRTRVRCRYLFCFIILWLSGILTTGYGQTKPTALTLSQPFEKVYLHTDRVQYVAGDTIWLAAYRVNATDHSPRAASQTLYVHLLDSTGRPKASPILHIDSSGHASTAITLADSLPAGTYQLLAYTNWMRNSDNDFLFRKRIRIEAANRQVAPISLLSTGLHVQLFPEGGHLVTGLASRVAFEARDQQGNSLSVRGVLINEKGDTLTDFRSLHQGMGIFTMTPHTHQHYRAVVRTADGRNTSVELPDALLTGYQLAVDNVTHANQVRVVIQASQPQPGLLTLFAHLRGRICYEAQLDAARTAIELSIPYDSIPQDGIVHLTLFNAQTQPVAERLVFINRQNQLAIHIQTDQARYQPHQPVSLSISVTDPTGQPVATQLSLAVTDRHQTIELAPYEATLRSYLLLSSDVKGTVDEPDYYFDTTQVHARQYLDYVMMTHGWRRFSWQTILSDSTTQPVYKPESGLTLAGQVRYGDDKKIAREVALTGMLKANRQLLPLTVVTDKEGRLMMENLLFADTATLVLRHRTNRPIQFALDKQSLPAFVRLPEQPIGQVIERQASVSQAFDMQALMRRLRANGGRMLQAVTVKANRYDASRHDYRRMMYGTADATVVATDQMRSMSSILSMIMGQVAGVDVRMNPDGGGSLFIRNDHAAVMIDGTFVKDQVLQTINPNDVEAIDVLKNPATYGIFGLRAPFGVVNILLRQGPGQGKKINQAVSDVMGYAVSREFYSPDYAKQNSSSKPVDYRTTLYWNPALRTDAKGQAKVVFYNSDSATTIQVVAEGINEYGQPGYKRTTYAVQAK